MNALAAGIPLGRNGMRVGPMAYGVAALGNLLRPVSQQEWEGAMPAAWESGVRYVDVAPHYGLGLAERRLGHGLRGRPRDEFLIPTKVGRLPRPVANSTGARDDEGFDVPADFVRVRDYSRDGIRRWNPACSDSVSTGSTSRSYTILMTPTPMLSTTHSCPGRAPRRGHDHVVRGRDEPVGDAHPLRGANRLDAVCHRHGTPLPAVAAQFPLGHPAVRTVCLGAYSAAQVRRNAALFEIDVPEELWSELRAEGLLRADAPTPRQENAHR
jgi:aryl-alcohol dehydrogenase-like predicted oxidoreductase